MNLAKLYRVKKLAKQMSQHVGQSNLFKSQWGSERWVEVLRKTIILNQKGSE
jgi:hypothetical protein